ncbi:MAG TPA: hypothetical protein PLX85_09885, partial [Dehalococcoidia bacterium]|nr:hypothetical protein [Dehalococcoidia bacterium]
MAGDHVHVALNDDHAVGAAGFLASAVEAVQRAALVEEGGLRGVEVLRVLVGGEGARAEADEPASTVSSREDQTVAKAVVEPTITVDGEAGIAQVGVGEATRAEVLDEAVPFVGGIADLPGLDGGGVETALLGVGEGRGARRAVDRRLRDLHHQHRGAR